MAHKYRQGQLKNIPLENLADDVNSGYRKLLRDYEAAWAFSSPERAIDAVIDVARFFNSFIEDREPWVHARSSHAEDEVVINEVLYDSIEAMRIVAILISPVLPKAAHGIFDQLSWKMESSGKEERFSLADAEWGGLPDAHVVGKPTPLFPRIETSEL